MPPVMAEHLVAVNELEEGRNLSQLQFVLRLAHSNDVIEQQKVMCITSSLR
jgi:hypothetical protein